MSKEQSALIILSPGFPKDETDTSCLPFPQLLVKTIKASRPALKVIVLAMQYPFARRQYAWHDVQVMAFNGRSRGKLWRLLNWLAVMQQLSTIAKQHRVVGIMNFWMGECAWLGERAAKKYNWPCFTWLLGQDARPGNAYVKRTQPKAKNIIALSDALANAFYENYKIMPANIIPPGVDPLMFAVPVEERDIDILGVGSLIPLKQFSIFVSVIAAIVPRYPQLKAVICGDGSERETLKRQIEERGLSRNVFLHGQQKHDEVLRLMQRAKILLHPSSYEGFATVYSEALYAGAHVVGFCRPMNEVFPHLHIVQTEEEMLNMVITLLETKQMNHQSVMPYHINDTCRKTLALFGI